MAKKKQALKTVKELTQQDKFYIEGHPTEDHRKLAVLLQTTPEVIEQYKCSLPQQKQIERYIEIVSSNEKAGKHITTKSGATILSQAAAEIADAQRIASPQQRDLSDRIHKMK